MRGRAALAAATAAAAALLLLLAGAWRRRPAAQSLVPGFGSSQAWVVGGHQGFTGPGRKLLPPAAALPFWWCAACPAVLGLLAPLVIHYGLAELADELCELLKLSPEECWDLWWAAFALALLLSLASAAPIVYACRLPECVRRGAA